MLSQPSSGPAHRQRVDRWVHRVMRDVTLDPGVRLYHARHSLCTWADLALRAIIGPMMFTAIWRHVLNGDPDEDPSGVAQQLIDVILNGLRRSAP